MTPAGARGGRSAVAEADRRSVEALLGRASTTDFRVVMRCPHGAPAVLANEARDRNGRPFPTRNWLACRALVTGVSRLEAAGGARALGAAAELDRDLHRAQLRHAELHDGHLVAGATSPSHVKCLHAHLAFALAEGGTPVGDSIWSQAKLRWPDRCCVAGVGSA